MLIILFLFNNKVTFNEIDNYFETARVMIKFENKQLQSVAVDSDAHELNRHQPRLLSYQHKDSQFQSQASKDIMI